MSEYQYYEFQAIDRPLTDKQMQELRKYSTRATITPTSFVNVYNWGSFKGNWHEWMEKYFDAFLYVANWGSHWLQFRLPNRLLEREILSAYCADECLTSHARGEYVIVSFVSEEEPGEWEEGEGWLASLTPLRDDLMNGDHRSLYLGWLLALQACELDSDAIEPPVPPGLGSLSAPLQSLADFLGIDPDLIAAAAEKSGNQPTSTLSRDNITRWIAKMSRNEKDAVIAALLEGENLHVGQELRRRAMHELHGKNESTNEIERRTVMQLADRAEAIANERRHREAEIRARDKAKRERERAEARKKLLESLAGKEDSLWSKVDTLISTKQPKRYDEAVSLLQDLQDLATMGKQDGFFASRMEALCRKHARKPSLLDKIRKAHLMGGEQ